MTITDLNSLKAYFKQFKPNIFGAGVYAFNRLGMETVDAHYRLLALRDSLDTALIGQDIKTFSLERGMGTKHIREPRNATTVLTHKKTKAYLAQFKDPAILIHKPSKKMERVCRQNNWRLIANPTCFGKALFENKINFRKILEELGLPAAPGKIIRLDNLHYGHLINSYGLPFVIQHPGRGGGKGTFFIHNIEEFNLALRKIKHAPSDAEEELSKEKKAPDEVIVTRFIQGTSPSLTGCITRHGILSTNLQHQVLDIPQLYNPEKGSGLFCGHDWTASRFSEKISKQSYEYTDKIGQYFKKHGYKGIFGLDFILDQKTDKLYLVECNPRLLGSFPTIIMAQIRNNEPPILAFHALEFLEADYQVDIEAINQLIRRNKTGSQMILHNLTGRWTKNHCELKAGVYRLKNNRLIYLRPGYDLKHLQNEEEFLLADGVPFKKSHFSPNRRLCRVLSLHQVLDENNYKQLNPWARQVAETVYQSFDLRPIRFIRLKKFFFPHFLAKG